MKNDVLKTENSFHEVQADEMYIAAEEASDILKVLSNPARLRLLCALVPGDKTVGELEDRLGASQSYVSGQLARMRHDGLVNYRREGRTVYYRLDDPRIRPILETLYTVFCPEK